MTAIPGNPRPTSGVACLPLFLLLAWLPAVAWAAEKGFRLEQSEVLREPGHFLVNLHIDYRLSREMLDALRYGIPLEFRVEVELRRVGWLYDPRVAQRINQRRLEYHVLSGLYQVTDLQHDTQRSFALLREALQALGNLRRLRLATQAPATDSGYRLRARADLAVDALPAPLQPHAYLHPAWQSDLPWKELPPPKKNP